MLVKPIKTRVFQEGEDLYCFITRYISRLSERSIIVVTSKIIALSEKRTVIVNNQKTKENFIKQECDIAIPTKHVWLTIKDGMLMADAGIDESNAKGKLILLPRDSFKSARILRNKLKRKYNIKKLGVIITDSRTLPLRAGVVGAALGYAGFRGIKDYRGKRDIFGRKFKFSQTDIADSLATSATLVMGEGKEQQPLAIIKNAPIVFYEKVYRRELRIDFKDDMYRPLFVSSIGKLNRYE